MKILIDHPLPFFLAHGGFQTQIEQTHAALLGHGLDVEHVRWWDEAQWGDIIHFFGRPDQSYIDFAQQKGMRVVVGELLTGLASRSNVQRAAQRTLMRAARTILPGPFVHRLSWRSYEMADACIALTAWEARLMEEMFEAPPERVHVVPNGVEAIFLEEVPASERGPWLVCTATITERKRVLELARAAILARTPIWIIGRPYAEGDPYCQEFRALTERGSEFVRFEGAVTERAQLARVYREARGFVLLSTMESLSLSALEAAACGCPLLLTDLPWSRSSFGDQVRYCPVTPNPAQIAPVLRAFYEDAPQLRPPHRPLGWPEVARRLAETYTAVCCRPAAARTSS